MTGGLFALNFFSPAFIDQLKRGRKTATIRLGDKSRKYQRGQIVWITVGHQHSPREKIFTAVIDDVEVKRVRELSPRDIEHDNPEFRRLEETLGFLRQIYGHDIDHEDTVTVIRFSQVVESVGTQFGNGEPPSPQLGFAAVDARVQLPHHLVPGGPARARLGRDLGLREMAAVVAWRDGGREARRRRRGRGGPGGALHLALEAPVRPRLRR